MTTILITLALLAILLAIVNAPALIRALRAGSAQAGAIRRRCEDADPLALLNQAVDDGVASIQNAKKGLENYRGLILSVQRQVENGEKEKARLESRIREAIDAGDPKRTAHEYALMLADVEQNIAANREQLQRHKETYENFAKQVEVGQSRVLAARQKAELLGLELEQSKREKEMARFAQDFSFNPKGLDTDLSRAEELIYQKIDANRAVGHVAEDLTNVPILPEMIDEEKERKAAAAKILERFTKQPPLTQS
jgi:phage shock protein A